MGLARGMVGVGEERPVMAVLGGDSVFGFADPGATKDSGGVGSGASVVLINSNDVFTSLQYVIQNPINGITIPIISQSYGACEASYTTSDLNSIQSQLQQANAQGQTVILAAGDTGAADCDDSATETIVTATQGLAVDYPGSSPYVTDVGGTEFMGDGTSTSPQTGAGTYWTAAASSSTVLSSPLRSD